MFLSGLFVIRRRGAAFYSRRVPRRGAQARLGAVPPDLSGGATRHRRLAPARLLTRWARSRGRGARFPAAEGVSADPRPGAAGPRGSRLATVAGPTAAQYGQLLC